MVVKMVELGTALCTRRAGREAYNSAAPAVLKGMEVVVFDFDGVGTVTNSFADELFGRMAAEMGMDYLRAHTSFKNVKPVAAFTIRRAMELRAASDMVGVESA